MTDNTESAAPKDAPPRDTGALLLAAGGLAAAFGAASCCALPLLLGSLGLGGAWLAMVAWVAAPHRVALLAIAIACLVSGAGAALWHRRGPAASTPCAIASRRPAVTALVAAFLSLGTILVVLGFIYA
jgi:mercuric ion transport protein